ncbi:MAG: trigger factor [Spirochaetaceae bacterium]
MVSDKQVEKLENSSVRLTVTVPKEEVKREYDDLLAGYAKNVQIKGFRKGKVPRNVLERKFGDSFKVETAQKVIDSALQEVFQEIEEKPLPYAQPELEGELDLEPEEPLTFTVKYDVFPDVEVGETTGLTIEEPQVSIKKEDEERELKQLQEQNSVVMEKDSGTVEKENIVTIDYVELDDQGNEVEDTKREDFVFTVGSGYNLYRIDDEVIGMKAGEQKVIEKEYPEEFEFEELRGKKKKLKVTCKLIKERQLPEIDDELAQDISEKYDSLEDLKKEIRERLEKSAEQRIREQKVDNLMAKIEENSKVAVPESMVYAELAGMWQNFVGQYGGSEEQVEQLLQIQGKSKADILAEWREGAEKQLRRRLIVQKLIDQAGIEISEEEAEADLKKRAEESGANAEEALEYYKNNNMLDYIKQDLAERKLFDELFEKNSVKKGKKQSFLDLMQGKQ